MRLVRIAIIVLFITSLIAGCNRPQDPGPVTKAVTERETTPVEAYGDFVKIRRTKPVDFIALTKIYGAHLASYVQATDQRYGMEIDSTVTKALALGATGQEIFANAQIAEKSIQRAFLATFTQSVETLTGAPTDKSALQRATESAPVVRATAQRRSKWAGKENQYCETFDAAMKQLNTAVESGNAKLLDSAGASLNALWRKVIVLSVFYELGGLAKERGADADVASEKRAEAYVYYLNLTAVHQQRNQDGASAVNRQLSLSPEEVDIDAVRQILAADFEAEVAGVERSLLGL